MYAVARYQLRLSEEDFFDITPLQFTYLTLRYEQEREASDFRAGVIASTTANCHRKKGKKAFKPKDFMPDYGAPVEKQQGPEQMKMMAMTLNAMYGGTFNKEKAHGGASNS